MANGDEQGLMGDDSRVHLEVPRSIFVYLLGGSVFIGAGGMATIKEPLDKAAVTQCFDNSKVALDVVAQHGEEFNSVRDWIRRVENNGYSRNDAEKEQKRLKERIDLLQEEYRFLESRVSRLEK